MGSDFVAVRPLSAPSADEPDLDTRERLVKAAIEVFLEKGYGGTRVQDIARRAGFTSGALYVHFPSRSALLGEAIMKEGRSILAGLTERLQAATDANRVLTEVFAEFSGSPLTTFDLLLLEALALGSRSADALDSMSETMGAFIGLIQAQVDNAAGSGSFADDLDPAAIRQLVLAGIFGSVVVKSVNLGGASVEALALTCQRMIAGLSPS